MAREVGLAVRRQGAEVSPEAGSPEAESPEAGSPEAGSERIRDRQSAVMGRPGRNRGRQGRGSEADSGLGKPRGAVTKGNEKRKREKREREKKEKKKKSKL